MRDTRPLPRLARPECLPNGALRRWPRPAQRKTAHGNSHNCLMHVPVEIQAHTHKLTTNALVETLRGCQLRHAADSAFPSQQDGGDGDLETKMDHVTRPRVAAARLDATAINLVPQALWTHPSTRQVPLCQGPLPEASQQPGHLPLQLPGSFLPQLTSPCGYHGILLHHVLRDPAKSRAQELREKHGIPEGSELVAKEMGTLESELSQNFAEDLPSSACRPPHQQAITIRDDKMLKSRRQGQWMNRVCNYNIYNSLKEFRLGRN